MSGLWAWIVSFFRRNERCLFRYWDGSKQRAIDPVASWRLVWNDLDCNLLEDSKLAQNPIKEDGAAFYPIAEVIAAEDRLRDLTRKIFGVQVWSESQAGLTVDETDELLNRFMDFCGDIKKKRKPSPTASPPTDSKAPPFSPGIDPSSGFPAGADADYCSWQTESTDAAPTGP